MNPWKRREVIGNAELYLGDCLEIIPHITCQHEYETHDPYCCKCANRYPTIDAVITDPPYGIEDSPIQGQGRTGKRTGGVNMWHPESWWDKEIRPEWAQAACEVAPVVAWFGQWRKREQVSQAMTHPLRAEIVWAKDCHSGPPCPVAPRDERIWIFGADGIRGATFETSVWDEQVIPTWSHKEHKNEKPAKLMRRLIAWTGAQTVLDPFMGSGTTGIACMNLGRKFIGIEIEERYFQIACERIENAQRQERLFA